MARIVDVAKLAGTSVSTVNRVLKGLPVKKSTKTAVVNAKNKLKYRMDIQLDEAYSNSIRVEFGSHYRKDTFVLNLLEGIKTGAKINNSRLMISIKGIDDEFSKLDTDEDVDGYLMVGTTVTEEELFIRQLEKTKKPFLFVNRKFERENISFVSADNMHGAYLAVKHLISGSRKKVAILKGDASYMNSYQRLEGYKKALEEASLKINEKFILDGNFNEQTSYHKVKELLKGKDIPDAIFSSSDNMAFGALKAIREASLKIPDDIAIAGYDNIDLCSFFDPQLTSVSVNGFNMGMLATDMLVKLINDRSIGEVRILLIPELIIRQSS